MIAIVAPFPQPETVRDGWRRRIAAVDGLLDTQRRVYLEIVDDGGAQAPDPQRVSELVDVYRLNLGLAAHYERLRNIVLEADLVYVHTVHLARFVLPFYRTGKIVTDIHGAAPEEERVYGREASGRFYDEVERVVLRDSRNAVAVTQALVDHLRAKHPASRTEFIVLPIRTARPDTDADLGPRSASARPSVVYSGGLQRWQNVDLMIDVAGEGMGRFDFTFLTSDPGGLEVAARKRSLGGRIQALSVSAEDLPAHYRRADYGLVLRDESVVNRVSCPTKLSEYLAFGVIPVLKFPALGDFERFGYRYVTLDDFRAGRLPAPDEQRAMRRQNLEVMAALEGAYERGAKQVRGLAQRASGETVPGISFLSDIERNVLFPAESSLEVEGVGQASRVLTTDFAEPYHAVHFDLGAAGETRRVTWTPINRECRIRLKHARLADETGREIVCRMSGNYAQDADGVLVFLDRPPRIHFDLEPGSVARTFSAEFDILQVGDEARRPAVPAARPASRLRDRVRARLRSYPFVVKAYRRWFKRNG